MKITAKIRRPAWRSVIALLAAGALVAGALTFAPALTTHRSAKVIRLVAATAMASPADTPGDPPGPDSPPSGGPPATSSPGQCVNTLTCTVADINSWTVAQRIEFVGALQNGPAQQFQAGFQDWNAIIGILYFFQFHHLCAPGSWASYTDAGILVGIERGLALALGFSPNPVLDANPGAALWQKFLGDLKAGTLTSMIQHDLEWGQAEQQSTNWGTEQAPSGVMPSAQEQTWFQFSQAFRWIMQNEQPFIVALSGINDPALTALFNTFTSVNNVTTTFFFAELAWEASGVLNALGQVLQPGWATNATSVYSLLNALASNENSCTSCDSMPSITLAPLSFTETSMNASG